LDSLQAQTIKAADAPWLKTQMEAADVIVAQPLYSTPVVDVRVAPLRAWTAATGTPLIMIPALQYDVIFPSVIPVQWPKPSNYPFGATENVMIAAGFVCGMSVTDTASFFHDVPLLQPGRLQERMEKSALAYQQREADAVCTIAASAYYAQNWRSSRLHFIKGHPLPDVLRHFSAALAQALGIDDFNPSATAALTGPHGYRMPIQRWVKAQLETSFKEADDTACRGGTEITLHEMIEGMFQWYATIGADEVKRKLQGMGHFNRAIKLAVSA
jgi:hypothetical protein